MFLDYTFKVTKNEKLAKVSWRYIMNQFKTRIEKYNYIRTQQKAKRMKAAKRTLPIVGTAMILSPAVLTMNNVKVSAAEMGQTQNQSAFIEQLGASLQKVRQAMQALGYQNMNEIMSFSTLSLPVSPAIKVTDFGMMDTKSQRFYPLVFPEDGVLLHENTH